ncbi:MAG: 2Fe-2S iron-sulfur cluster-binding protein [Mariniblastus sp.]
MTELLQTAIPFAGIALCVMSLFQFALWSRQSLNLISENKKQFELSRELMRNQIQERQLAIPSKVDSALALSDSNTGAWKGFRSFRVSQLVKETDLCTSVYLLPDDGKSIPAFRPGQHLTFKFQIPGESKPIVRCYSLSSAPGKDYYRISVKAVPAPRDKPEFPPGRASNYINHALSVGQRIDVKAPSGHFVLDENSDVPVVMLAGGIGVTPMVSISDHLLGESSNRQILLMYGVQHGKDHAFKEHFANLSEKHENFHVVNCYSHPNKEDIDNRTFHVDGYASVDCLKKVLPSKQCQFYMCGPPPFMESLYSGLLEWGVPESSIFFEAFGPASIGKKKKSESSGTKTSQANGPVVNFATSGTIVRWDSDSESLLELAEANDIVIESGCRAGSCGTCETSVLKGKVTYDDPQNIDCPPGKCLACVARPDGPVELDA